jgi:hypothetical protein
MLPLCKDAELKITRSRERFLPSSVEYMLERYDHVSGVTRRHVGKGYKLKPQIELDGGGFLPSVSLFILKAEFPAQGSVHLAHILQALSSMSASALDQIQSDRRGPYLSISNHHRPSPFFADQSSDYLYGSTDTPGKEIGSRNGTMIKEMIYGFWVERERGVVVSRLHLRLEQG